MTNKVKIGIFLMWLSILLSQILVMMAVSVKNGRTMRRMEERLMVIEECIRGTNRNLNQIGIFYDVAEKEDR